MSTMSHFGARKIMRARRRKDRMTNCLKEQALFVGDIDERESINLSSPPASGKEYIKRVVIEAQRYDDVVVAKVDKTRLKNQTVVHKPLAGCIEAPAQLGPTLNWQQCQVADFSDVRLYVSRLKSEIRTTKHQRKAPNVQLPDMDDEDGWYDFCLGSTAKGYEARNPKLDIVFSMNQPTIEQVLEYLVHLIGIQRKIEPELGRWVYALLVVLELPLNPDMCSCLRTLARTCSVIRADTSTVEMHKVGTLNLFICLVARYFRQLDLMDP